MELFDQIVDELGKDEKGKQKEREELRLVVENALCAHVRNAHTVSAADRRVPYVSLKMKGQSKTGGASSNKEAASTSKGKGKQAAIAAVEPIAEEQQEPAQLESDELTQAADTAAAHPETSPCWRSSLVKSQLRLVGPLRGAIPGPQSKLAISRCRPSRRQKPLSQTAGLLELLHTVTRASHRLRSARGLHLFNNA